MPEICKIRVGLCAMSKKVNSKPMKEILKGIEKAPYIKLIIFDENTILTQPVCDWPICDAFISFYSHSFPLNKAIEYADLRKPFLMNDLRSQKVLLNRKSVYKVLQKNGIAVPNHIVVDWDNHNCNVSEQDDAIEVDGQIIHKPFVEKPLDAEDHNIYIYFPITAGSGCQKLFRKVGDRSSKYSAESCVRTKGAFIYEDFMPTDGTDVKIYTVGDDYAHAEARKSPALDGKVERDSEGKEVRYPVILSLREKIMAKKVSQAVKQQICGFDLLRANGMSYVCDVNGFSFVKSSPKYYEDCAHILLMIITQKIAPQLFTPKIILPADTSNLVPTTSGSIMELRCVIGVIRHGDRTPKQKMKMEVKHDKFFQLFRKYSNDRLNDIKLKKPKQLQEVLDIVRYLLNEADHSLEQNDQIKDQRNKFQQFRNVLEMHGHFSGINRKVQMKYKSPIKCQKHNFNMSQCNNYGLLLIVKWGGELTKAGKLQAEKLGKAFRCLYPGSNGNYGNDAGLGLLRLHSTYRHDLKIYASDEGRVQMTAAAFAKGFLALEGELPPILVQMVKSANTNGLLDNDNDCRHYQVLARKRICEIMSQNKSFSKNDIIKIAPTNTQSLISALKEIHNPVKMCDILMSHLINLNLHLNDYSVEERNSIVLYHEESWELLLRRWNKLLKDFKPKETYDISKISDIYDNIKYDIQHNPCILVSDAVDFFACAKSLADIIVPQEYGVSIEEKMVIGQRICTPLLRKILSDTKYTDVDECTRLHAGYSEGVASPERLVRTRLYFTSESHLHSLLNSIRYGGLADVSCDEQWKRAMDYVNSVSELNYLSQIVIMIYEDPSQCSKLEKNRFHVEIHFSPGAFTGIPNQVEGTGYRPQNLERNLSRAESNASLTMNSKVISRSSSINEKQDSKIQSTDEDKEAGFNMRDLLMRLSRKKKSKRSNRNSATESILYNENDIRHNDNRSSILNDDEIFVNEVSSKFKVRTVQLSESDISTDSSEKPETQNNSVLNLSFGKLNIGPENSRSRSNLIRNYSSSKDEEENQELNYLTYPARDLSLLYSQVPRPKWEKRGSAKITSSRFLISTDVIMGAKHHSTGSIPSEFSDETGKDKNSREMNLPCAPCVPEISSLETLHNALNLNHLEKFLTRLVSQKLVTPSNSPK